MNQEQVQVKTPEYVSLQFQSAGLGSRASAFIIDQAIIMIANITILIGAIYLMDFMGLFMGTSWVPIAIVTILAFLINWGYFFFLEYFTGGRTLGKKMLGIRVMQENGHSITLLSSFIRNLLRIVDQLPAGYLLGILMIFFHSKHKRLGDLAAGTLVVHERRVRKRKKKTAIEKEIERRGITR
ncbi:RDD family protein [Halalkalibacter hemicellulosilyticus]|uniref:Integral membrane protein n=1 Tax=Halalkalibacter hemicellulosilyticusJCM 9152 TaxID=1236971 RepID=W4QDD2_9BACI|nr:integral membrane protein [Halalkalibacter hemicellulosilyticusJCM 9152]